MFASLLAVLLSSTPEAAVSVRTPELSRSYQVTLPGASAPCQVTRHQSCDGRLAPGRVRLQVDGSWKEVSVGGGRYDLVVSQSDRRMAWVGLGLLVISPVFLTTGMLAYGSAGTPLSAALLGAGYLTLPLGAALTLVGLIFPGVEVKAERRYGPAAMSLSLAGDRWSVSAGGRF